MSAFPWAPAGIAFVVGVVATPLVLRAALRFGLLDRPNERSSHTRVTPRGGGVAVALACAAALLVAGTGGGRGAVFLAGALAMALLGLGDDRFDLPVLPRLAAQALVAGVVVWAIGGLESLPLPAPLDLRLGWLGGPLAVLWILAVVNFYNFLDGIDGLAGLQGVVTGVGIALAAWDPFAASLGAAAAGACLAFLTHNWSPARVFLGDAGSLLLGYTFAALPLLSPPRARGSSVFLMAMSLWLFLADATWTRLRMIAREPRWYGPHRNHVYQRLVASGWSHARTSLVIGAASALLTGAGLWAWSQPEPGAKWAVLALAATLFLAELVAARRREARA
ncbi:MAG TPA: glycosyl transferase [Vicinamibacteria bacterium]|nr:glycosyl transferase [Vicinamibacteria bacterium]